MALFMPFRAAHGPRRPGQLFPEVVSWHRLHLVFTAQSCVENHCATRELLELIYD